MDADETLPPQARLQAGDWAALLPAIGPGLEWRVIEPLRVVALRHLPGGTAAVEAAAARAGLPSLPSAGAFCGADPLVVWRQPREWVLVSTADAAADGLLAALKPGAQALAVAVDQSAGSVGIELRGPQVDAVLARLVDASAVPREPGHGTRARLADIAVTMLRLAPSTLWLIADHANDRYLADWLAYASQAVQSAELNEPTESP